MWPMWSVCLLMVAPGYIHLKLWTSDKKRYEQNLGLVKWTLSFEYVMSWPVMFYTFQNSHSHSKTGSYNNIRTLCKVKVVWVLYFCFWRYMIGNTVTYFAKSNFPLTWRPCRVRVTMLSARRSKFLNKMKNGSCIFDNLKVTLWYLAFYIILWVFFKRGFEFSWFQLTVCHDSVI